MGNIERGVENAYRSAQAKTGKDEPTLREVWLWIPTIHEERIVQILTHLNLPLGTDVGAQAEEAFNSVLSLAKNHDHLTLLANAGWVEGFPSEDFWSFRHEKFPGVLLVWTHGETKARARREA